MPTTPNIQELLELAAGIQGEQPVNTDDPNVVANYLNVQPALQQPAMPAIQPGQTIKQYAQSSTTQPSILPGARQSVTPPATQQPTTPQPGQPTTTQPPSNTDVSSSYELYSKILQNTLGASPELDKKKRNQLAMVAGINALGQALKQVVDYTGRVKHGAPINPQTDQLTPVLLVQYEKEMQDYLARKSQYDLQKTNTLQEAMKMAYGDKAAQDAYNRDLEKLAREQGYDSRKTAEERGWRTNERVGAQDFESGMLDKKMGWETDERKDKQDWQSNENDTQRRWLAIQNELDRLAAQKRAGSGSGSKLVEEIENGWEVMDNKNGQVATLPKVMFWDVLTRELKGLNMTPDQMLNNPERIPSKGYNSTDEEAKAIVTNGWNKYYDAVYGPDGQQIGWTAKPEAGNTKTIWDFIPLGEAPKVNDGGDSPAADDEDYWN